MPSVESRCAWKWLELSFPFYWGQLHSKVAVYAVRGILGQYQYYCMLCLVTHIVGSNLKSKNQEVSGFIDEMVLNAIVDFNEI